MKKNIKAVLRIQTAVLALVLASCASIPLSKFPSDGVYSYDFERYVDCIEAIYIYKSYGMDAYQNIQKNSWGNAVLMQDGSFVEPETGILISISPKGEVFSPENPSINGMYKKNGDFFFQGYYEENSQINRISVSGRLLFSDRIDRASALYDGDFILTDNGTERKQKVRIEDGLSTWEYAERQDDDFETWPVIVSSDGTISSGFEMTVRSGVKNLSEMLVSSTNQTIGKVDKNGTVVLKTLTRNYGTGQSGESSEVSFNGIRGSTNFNQIQKEHPENSKTTKKLTKSKGKNQNPAKENPPEWFSDFIPNDESFLYGSARKTHGDKETALKIAELTAVSQIRSSLVQRVTTYTEAKKSMSEGIENRKESSFFSAVDTFSSINIPYSVKNSSYDEKTETAYVVVCLPREEADKIMKKSSD